MNKDFNDRLNRLGHKPAAPPPEPLQTPPPKPSSLHGVIFGGVALALVVAGYFLFPLPKRVDPMAAIASTYLKDEKPPQVRSASLLGGPGIDHDYMNSCLAFMPAAPDGWVRVNSWDARYPQLMPKLSAIWQATGQSIEASAGYDALNDFVDYFSGPYAKSTNLAGFDTVSSAIYLNVENGSYIWLSLSSRAWRESSNCKDEFLYQWQQFDQTAPRRQPVLTQFSYDQMRETSDGVPDTLRDQGFKRVRHQDTVSPGLEIEVTGISKYGDVSVVLNGEDIVQKVNAALQHRDN